MSVCVLLCVRGVCVCVSVYLLVSLSLCLCLSARVSSFLLSHPTCPTTPVPDPTTQLLSREMLYTTTQANDDQHTNRQVSGSYGMHDLNNYRSVLKGQNCTLHF